MEQAAIQPQISLIVIIYASLFIFGIAFNALIGWAERHHYLEGYLSFTVAAGVLITLGGTALFSWQFALLTLGAFIASGLPMVAGSMLRYAEARRREHEYERQAATLAEQRKRSEG
jgi:hypothetical protein